MCVFIPGIHPILPETGDCPDRFRLFDNKEIIKDSPICIQANIPPGYTCKDPLRCTRPREAVAETFVITTPYKTLRDAYR